MNKILFINTLHSSFDDRTFYHHALALSQESDSVRIFSTLEAKNETINNISFCSEKIYDNSFFNQLKSICRIVENNQPDIVICDSPLGILATFFSKNKCTVIYDVTEWIPSKKNLKNSTLLLLPIKFLGLLLLNITAGFLTDKFIFGEYYKAVPFNLFFWKKRIVSSYYPDLNYIQSEIPSDISHKVRFYYSGWFNAEKGFDKVLKLIELVAGLNTNITIELQLTGSYSSETDKNYFESIVAELPQNVVVISSNFKSFHDFCAELKYADIFLDLRKNDFENTRCLPIKLFYYMSCGRPVIYSGLKAIKNELDISGFGFLFEKNDLQALATGISDYITNHDLYNLHCDRAKDLSEKHYNWAKIKNEFVSFVLKN